MFTIELNASIKEHLFTLTKDKSAKDCQAELQTFLKSGCIPVNALSDYYEKYWKNEVELSQLMTPLNFRLKPKYIPGSNYSPEFKKELETLNLQRQELEYQNLIKKRRLSSQIVGNTNEEEEITLATLNKAIREQITTVFNVLVSVASVVVAIWYWTGSSSNLALHYRVITCLFFGILVLIAEVVVYNSYLNKIEDAKKRERTKKETKKVVKKIVL